MPNASLMQREKIPQVTQEITRHSLYNAWALLGSLYNLQDAHTVIERDRLVALCEHKRKILINVIEIQKRAKQGSTKSTVVE